jgi:hypothetical protein
MILYCPKLCIVAAAAFVKASWGPQLGYYRARSGSFAKMMTGNGLRRQHPIREAFRKPKWQFRLQRMTIYVIQHIAFCHLPAAL